MFQIENDEILEIEKQNAIHIIISLMKTYSITLRDIPEGREIQPKCLPERLHIALAD